MYIFTDMTTKKVRTRFAPSPTGNLHIGGARTALYAYLLAKKDGGAFVLRIEDTDRERSVEGSIQVIENGLRWLGIEWDEGIDNGGDFGPYLQSERQELYKTHVDQLLESKKAYRCFCTSERLDQMRSDQQKNKQAPKYDRTCLALQPEDVEKKVNANESFVVRLLVPGQGSVVVHDLIRGDVSFDVKDIDDQVLLKSDGFPTYHLANVVDDHLMEMTHVIRGEEWLPSTPKHVLLYKAFGWEAPAFAHLSLFLSKNGGKMSKRDGATSLLQFRDQGYLPAAVNNFIALLGWNPKTEEEFFTLDELVQKFDLSMVNKANAIFYTDKLDWMNQHYLRQLTAQQMLEQMQSLVNVGGEHAAAYERFIEWFSSLGAELQESIWNSAKERAKTLLEVAETAKLAVNEPSSYVAEDLVWKKSDKETTIKILEKLLEYIDGTPAEEFLAKTLEEKTIAWISSTEWGNGDVLWPMRFALSGERKSPSPFELAELLQKDETIKRLQKAKQLLEEV